MAQDIRRDPSLVSHAQSINLQTRCFDCLTNLGTEVKLSCGTFIPAGTYQDQIKGEFSVHLRGLTNKTIGIIRIKILWNPDRRFPPSKMEIPQSKAELYDGLKPQVANYHEVFNRFVIQSIQGPVVKVTRYDYQQKFQAFTEELGAKVSQLMQNHLKEKPLHVAYSPMPASLEIDYPVEKADAALAVQDVCEQGRFALSKEQSIQAGRIAQIALDGLPRERWG